ncbi:uncharacterized protein LOC101451427 [Ceratitis capitata]|uniref:uncharacterized protein LOC101451427 n=1 Tax=Ceratitis capitata TaxID=7213 RepID=UPI000329CF5E|nr:uncharacterized protein LOC101451427 [Ceratitis capitata]
MPFFQPHRKSTRRTVLSLALNEVSPRVSYQDADENISRKSSGLFQPSLVIASRSPHKSLEGEIYQLNDDVDMRCTHNHDKADAKDLLSREPSFTMAFHNNSLLSYKESARKYEKQFQYEISRLLEAQPTAYEVVSLHRHLSYTTLWPPLHNRRELARSKCLFSNYTWKQKKHLYKLLQ